MLNRYYFVFLLLISFSSFANFNFFKDRSFVLFNEKEFSEYFNKIAFSNEQWPTEVTFQERKYELTYSLDQELTNHVVTLLKRYRSDYASVVVIDNNTGAVLTAVDYTKSTKEVGKNITFASTNPAASVFKLITAADLIENEELDPQSKISFNGKSTTLYKYQLKDKKNRWTRTTTLKKAFAYSNNVVFGKTAIKKSSFTSLQKMARLFGFEAPLLQMVDVGTSQLLNAETDYSLAELASGFNRKTLISPLHGAIMASIVANDGLKKNHYIIKEVKDKKQQRTTWTPQFEVSRVLSKEAAGDLKELMLSTVKRGTARGAFRPWKIKNLKNLEIGGKTGTITGGVPFGRRDWFISYMKDPNSSTDKGISLCVMIINKKHWYIKSPYLARKIMEYYYKENSSDT